MIKHLKSAGSFLLGLCICVGIFLIIGLAVKGGVWLSVRIYPWLLNIAAFTLSVTVFILLPLAVFRRTRQISASSIYLATYVFGVTLWVWGLLVTYSFWGVTGIVIGLLMAGIGVVPLAIIASAVNGMWALAGQLLLLLVITFGTRAFAIFLFTKCPPKDLPPEEQPVIDIAT